MNQEIEKLFKDFKVEGKSIPVTFLMDETNEETYITYQMVSKDNILSADDKILGYVDEYDFDIFSKTNYFKVMDEVKEKLIINGWQWQPSKDSEDRYEQDTKYYHKTLSFSKERMILWQK